MNMKDYIIKKNKEMALTVGVWYGKCHFKEIVRNRILSKRSQYAQYYVLNEEIGN